MFAICLDVTRGIISEENQKENMDNINQTRLKETMSKQEEVMGGEEKLDLVLQNGDGAQEKRDMRRVPTPDGALGIWLGGRCRETGEELGNRSNHWGGPGKQRRNIERRWK